MKFLWILNLTINEVDIMLQLDIWLRIYWFQFCSVLILEPIIFFQLSNIQIFKRGPCGGPRPQAPFVSNIEISRANTSSLSSTWSIHPFTHTHTHTHTHTQRTNVTLARPWSQSLAPRWVSQLGPVLSRSWSNAMSCHMSRKKGLPYCNQWLELLRAQRLRKTSLGGWHRYFFPLKKDG